MASHILPRCQSLNKMTHTQAASTTHIHPPHPAGQGLYFEPLMVAIAGQWEKRDLPGQVSFWSARRSNRKRYSERISFC
jgi:hypothetical protein